jgi:hypothetical protein
VLVVVLLAACGDEPAPSAESLDSTTRPATTVQAITTTVAPATTQPYRAVIIDRRAPTDEERSRLDAEGAAFECPHLGDAYWDYDDSPIEEDPGGLTSEQALLEVIDEFNEELRAADYALVPTTGWTELVEGSTTTFVHTPGEWRYVVKFSTHEPTGVFRPQKATMCAPDEYVPPTDPPTLPPATPPPYVETVPPSVAGTDVEGPVTLEGGYVVDGPLVMQPECGPPDVCVQMDALLEGELALVDGCALVGDIVSGARTLVLWPFGTRFDAANNHVVAPGEVRLPKADRVSIPGGYSSSDAVVALTGAELPSVFVDCLQLSGVEGFWVAHDPIVTEA